MAKSKGWLSELQEPFNGIITLTFTMSQSVSLRKHSTIYLSILHSSFFAITNNSTTNVDHVSWCIHAWISPEHIFKNQTDESWETYSILEIPNYFPNWL